MGGLCPGPGRQARSSTSTSTYKQHQQPLLGDDHEDEILDNEVSRIGTIVSTLGSTLSEEKEDDYEDSDVEDAEVKNALWEIEEVITATQSLGT